MDHSHILQCPVTGQQLIPADESSLEKANRAIVDGTLFDRDGTLVREPLEAACMTIDGSLLYPIRDGVYCLLPGSGIDMIRIDDSAEATQTASQIVVHEDKKSVARFYETVGWSKVADDRYMDGASFEDMRDVSADYRSRCHERINRFLPDRGDYILDAASGPIQFNEYLAYSRNFAYRICVDLSLTALGDVKAKLGDRAVCLQADMTRLPLRDDMVDAVLSINTIYHIPQEEQKTAFLELHRVLKPDSTAVVVYSWDSHAPAMVIALFPYYCALMIGRPVKRFLKSLLRSTRRLLSGATGLESESVESQRLYFFAHSYTWFREQGWPFSWKIVTWRSLSIPFLRLYIHRWFLGRVILAAVYSLEEAFPELAGRIGAYPLILILKCRDD